MLCGRQSYNSFLGLTNETGPNGGSTSLVYDSYGRPSTVTSPFGATVTNGYGYTSSPPFTSTSVNGRWTKTYLDGLGRAIKVETGSGTVVSVSETVYEPCACSPTGKVKKVSLPHDPADTNPVWTTYTYDGIGRTLTAVTKKDTSPDTISTTTYSYFKNTVTVTDAAGAWKTYTSDVLGQLTKVVEPDPYSAGTYVTNYTYDSYGHLTGVSMPRGGNTQTRTFSYTGALLTSTTNPENGTVTYTYNSDQTLLRKTDAIGQKTEYSYDSYKRVTQVRRYIGSTEQTCQREDYYYDSNPFVGGFSENVAGRLAAVQYKGGPSCNTTFVDMYSYNDGGAALKKRLRVTRSGVANSMDLDATYTYDNEGRMTAVQYPKQWNGSAWVNGPNLGNTLDSMGRLTKLRDLTASTDIIAYATYNAAGQLLTMGNTSGSPAWGAETRSYNSFQQLTSQSNAGLNRTYTYSSSNNNGKITKEKDILSGEEVVYAYDELNRLASAETVGAGWGQSYTFDGFGNLKQVTAIKGSVPTLNVSYNAATNRRTSDCADANGNINGATAPTCLIPDRTYDVANRLTTVSSAAATYAYTPGNQRLYKKVGSDEELTFWGANGQKLVSYELVVSGSNLRAQNARTFKYFGSRLIYDSNQFLTNGFVYTDRLGSTVKTYPFGQERPSATSNDEQKFATYFRDAESGLDYAMNRYHAPGDGRFLSPDPYMASGGPADPGSWNRYAYTRGDPIGRADPDGLCDVQTSQLQEPICQAALAAHFKVTATGSLPGSTSLEAGIYTGAGFAQAGGGVPAGKGGYAEVEGALKQAQSTISQQTQFSEDCTNGLAKIGNGIDASMLASVASALTLADAGSSAAYITLAQAVPNTTYGNAIQFEADNPLVNGTRQTHPWLKKNGFFRFNVYTWFLANPTMNAWSPLGGKMWIKADRLNVGTIGEMQALLMHEALHISFGIGDGDILDSLFGPGSSRTRPSSEITKWFLDNCF